MYIRGVDFSRANIIVGTDAEAPVPSSGGTGQLQAQDVVAARVVQAAGGEAVLQLGGQRVVVQTHVALNAGDKLFVRVAEANAGQVRLSVLASGPEDGLLGPPIEDAAIDDMLMETGLPTDARTRLAARAQIARDGTFDKAAVQKLVHDLRPFPEVTAREANAAALLQKAGAPVTPATVAVVASRAAPDAPPALGARLQAIQPGLEKLARGVGPLAGAAREVLTALKGLPLDADAGKVAQALKGWIDKLTPTNAKVREEPADRALVRVRSVLTSQNPAPRAGINNAAPAPTPASDLGSQLERLAGGLGAGHSELKRVMGEAVAELRYLQLQNGPTPPVAGPAIAQPEFLIPLMAPQLAPNPDGAWVQVEQRPARDGEAAHDARLTFVVDTEHLRTVQADLTAKDGVISLSLGVVDPEDRAFVEAHLDELRESFARHGFAAGRVATHQPRLLPPPARQAEGIGEIVRFDRRI